MYDFFRGKIASKGPTRLVLDVGGIGYLFEIPFSTCQALPASGETTVWAHLHVREEALKLFGFATQEERSLFILLIRVNGVGPAIALAILSKATVADTCKAIAEGRVDFLKSLKGIGPKTAQRLVTELQDAVGSLLLGDVSPTPSSGARIESDAVAALEVLGCPQKQAESAVRKAIQGGDTVLEDVVRAALKIAWPS